MIVLSTLNLITPSAIPTKILDSCSFSYPKGANIILQLLCHIVKSYSEFTNFIMRISWYAIIKVPFRNSNRNFFISRSGKAMREEKTKDKIDVMTIAIIPEIIKVLIVFRSLLEYHGKTDKRKQHQFHRSLV